MLIVVHTIGQIVATHVESTGEVTTCSEVIKETTATTIATASNTFLHTVGKEFEALRNRVHATACEITQRNQLLKHIVRIGSTHAEYISGIGIDRLIQHLLRINLRNSDGVQTICQVGTIILHGDLLNHTLSWANSQGLLIECCNNLRSIGLLVELHLELLQISLNVE